MPNPSSGDPKTQAGAPAAPEGSPSGANAAFMGLGGTSDIDPIALKSEEMRRQANGQAPWPETQQGSPPVNQAPTPAQQQAPKLLGRYDVTTEDGFRQAQEFLRQQQSEADKLRVRTKRLDKYEPLLEEIEQNPTVADGIANVLERTYAGPAGAPNAGTGDDTPPELRAEMVKDELGGETGEIKIDATQLKNYLDQRDQAARQNIRREVSSVLQTQKREEAVKQGIAAFLKRHPEVTQEQLDDMLGLSRNRPYDEVLEVVYTGYSPNARLQAEDRGRQEVIDQVGRAGALGPAVGALPGTNVERKKTLVENMRDEYLAFAKQDEGIDISDL